MTPSDEGGARSARPLTITIPDELPLAARAEELRAAIDAHQVVIVAGETGSGKSTQLPKLCLELGRGDRAGGRGALIGHTQPRRLAARTVADRVAAELAESALDDDGRAAAAAAIGYAVRFTDTVEGTRHKRIIFYCIGKNYELTRPHWICLGCFFNDTAHISDSCHIDPRLGRSNID